MARMSEAARELKLYIDNDAQLYRQQFEPILKNLMTKLGRGTYDSAKSVKLWGYLCESGAKKYHREFGGSGRDSWNLLFPVSDRKQCAEAFRDDFEDEAKLGNYDHLLPKKYQVKKNAGTKEIKLPEKVRGDLYYTAHGLKLLVRKVKSGEYFAHIEGRDHARWGNSSQIREDIEHFLAYGSLPREGRSWANPSKSSNAAKKAVKKAAKRASDRLVRARGSLLGPPGFWTEAEVYWETRGVSLIVNWQGTKMFFQGDDAYYTLENLGIDPADVIKTPSLFEVPESTIDEYAHLNWDANPKKRGSSAAKQNLLDVVYGSPFLMAYFATMLWAETADDGDEDDDSSWESKGYTLDDFDTEALNALIDDAHKFLSMPDVRRELGGVTQKWMERAGHDFWLTRQGHGAGFWDGDWPEPAATILTEASKKIGECWLFGVNGKISVN